MVKSRSNNAELAPGTHSVDRVRVTQRDGVYRCIARVKLNNGLVKRAYGQGSTSKLARDRARKKAEEMLARKKGTGGWSKSDPISKFITEVSIPRIENGDYAKSTKRDYRDALNFVLGNCHEETHKHAVTFDDEIIDDAVDVVFLQAMLMELAKLHGHEVARRTKNVISHHVLDPLEDHGLISANTLRGRKMNFKSAAKPYVAKQHVALTEDQFWKVFNWLTQQESTQGFPNRPRSAKSRALAIELTLLQMTTGMRQVEARQVKWSMVDPDIGAVVIPAVIAKNNRERVIPLLIPEIKPRLSDRQSAPDNYVIGAPADPKKVWDRAGCVKAVGELYTEMASALDIPLLATPDGKSHVWRISLNTILARRGVDKDLRTRLLGHTEAVNTEHYTDLTDFSSLIAAMDDTKS